MLIEFPRRDLAWAARRNLADHLRPGSAGGRGSYPHTQRFLIAAEVAVAVVLVVSGGLLLRSLLQLQSIDLGVRDRPGMIMVWMNPSPTRHPTAESRIQLYDDILRELAARPETTTVSGIDLPFYFDYSETSIATADLAAGDENKFPQALDRAVTPTYFVEHGIQLLAGRSFSERDRGNQPAVAIVSDRLARRLWPDTNPVGQQVRVGGTDDELELVTVVGVVADVHRRPNAIPTPS